MNLAPTLDPQEAVRSLVTYLSPPVREVYFIRVTDFSGAPCRLVVHLDYGCGKKAKFEVTGVELNLGDGELAGILLSRLESAHKSVWPPELPPFRISTKSPKRLRPAKIP